MGGGGAGRQGVWGGGSDYLLERCLHISKSYVSCLGIKYDVFYLFAKKKKKDLGLTPVFTFSINY